ncbi:MAG: hypothetical protein EON48_12825 [Acetobacteraceae bacterium]|nr:MAG: hypothetical protein EON48_12825 [Acetobacteraceae bacterium]
MAKTDWKTEAKALKKKVRKLRDSLTAAAGPVADSYDGVTRKPRFVVIAGDGLRANVSTSRCW